MTPDQLDTLVANLRRFEGSVPWMYRDNADAGNVTVGIGVLLASERDAVALPFRNTKAGRGATETEIAQAFAHVRSLPAGMSAGYYRGDRPIELPDEEVTALAVRRLNDVFLPGLARLMGPSSPDGDSRFDLAPWPAQQALVDLAWNLGLTGLAKFQRLLAAVRAGAWSSAAVESHVSTSRKERNDWRAEMFRSCG